MNALGPALTFWLRYPDEMNQLTADEPNTFGLAEPDRALEMARAVHRRASVELRSLMGECSVIVDNHFMPFMEVTERRRDVDVPNWWSTRTVLRMPGRRKVRPVIEIGVWLLESPPLLVPWLWARGGRRFEDRAVLILGERFDSRPGTPSRSTGADLLQSPPGIICLVPIRISLPAAGFDLDRTPLVAQVRERLTAITRDDITALLSNQ